MTHRVGENWAQGFPKQNGVSGKLCFFENENTLNIPGGNGESPLRRKERKYTILGKNEKAISEAV